MKSPTKIVFGSCRGANLPENYFSGFILNAFLFLFLVFPSSSPFLSIFLLFLFPFFHFYFPPIHNFPQVGNIFLMEWKLGKEREYNRIEGNGGGREERGKGRKERGKGRKERGREIKGKEREGKGK